MKFLKWQFGRQGSGYEILPIIYWKRLFFDCYLIKISTGINVPPHNDPVPGKKHYRFNCHFGRFTGGEFIINDPLIKIFKYLYLIRPDIQVHSLTKVDSGALYIFSVGWAVKE